MKRILQCIILAAVAFCFENAHADSAVLSWTPSVSPTTTGYNVYYGTSSGNYSYKVDAGNTTSITVSNLVPGTTYYFVATAYDATGDSSLFSSELSYSDPASSSSSTAGVLSVVPNASAPRGAPTLQFTAQSGHWYEVQATTDLKNWTRIWQSSVATANTPMQFTDIDAAQFSSRFYRLVLH